MPTKLLIKKMKTFTHHLNQHSYKFLQKPAPEFNPKKNPQNLDKKMANSAETHSAYLELLESKAEKDDYKWITSLVSLSFFSLFGW